MAPRGFRRGSWNFSRGGADFQKSFENCVDFFFRSTKLIIWALRNRYQDPSLTKFFCAAGKFLKKACRKILRSVSQKWISQKSTKGTLWVGRGSNSWGKRGLPPILNPLLTGLFLFINIWTVKNSSPLFSEGANIHFERGGGAPKTFFDQNGLFFFNKNVVFAAQNLIK